MRWRLQQGCSHCALSMYRCLHSGAVCCASGGVGAAWGTVVGGSGGSKSPFLQQGCQQIYLSLHLCLHGASGGVVVLLVGGSLLFVTPWMEFVVIYYMSNWCSKILHLN